MSDGIRYIKSRRENEQQYLDKVTTEVECPECGKCIILVDREIICVCGFNDYRKLR